MRTSTMTHTETFKPAHELAQHDRRFPNDSDDNRMARLALLAEEIELRRHTERVATQRRALPRQAGNYSARSSAGSSSTHDYCAVSR